MLMVGVCCAPLHLYTFKAGVRYCHFSVCSNPILLRTAANIFLVTPFLSPGTSSPPLYLSGYHLPTVPFQALLTTLGTLWPQGFPAFLGRRAFPVSSCTAVFFRLLLQCHLSLCLMLQSFLPNLPFWSYFPLCSYLTCFGFTHLLLPVCAGDCSQLRCSEECQAQSQTSVTY